MPEDQQPTPPPWRYEVKDVEPLEAVAPGFGKGRVVLYGPGESEWIADLGFAGDPHVIANAKLIVELRNMARQDPVEGAPDA